MLAIIVVNLTDQRISFRTLTTLASAHILNDFRFVCFSVLTVLKPLILNKRLTNSGTLFWISHFKTLEWS